MHASMPRRMSGLKSLGTHLMVMTWMFCALVSQPTCALCTDMLSVRADKALLNPKVSTCYRNVHFTEMFMPQISSQKRPGTIEMRLYTGRCFGDLWLLASVGSEHWAARYNPWLLIKLTPKGVVFSLLFLSQHRKTYARNL